MDLIFNLEEVELAKESQVSSFGVLPTGMYKNATIVRAVANKTKGGNNIIDLTLKTEDGKETTIYQAFELDQKWASGKLNEFGYPRWLRFAKACGMKSASTFKDALVKEDGTPIFKKGTQEQIVLTCYKELHGKKVDLGIQKVLDVYNGTVKESNEVYDSFACGSATSDKLAEKLTKTKETKEYKAFIANGGSPTAYKDMSATALSDADIDEALDEL